MAELKAELSSQYSYKTGLLEDILLKKPEIWLRIREDHKSDKATDRYWEGTQMGLREMKIKLDLKRIEKMISALSSRLRVAEREANTQW